MKKLISFGMIVLFLTLTTTAQAAESFARFDRNGDGIFDVTFVGAGEDIYAMYFDNDQDSLNDYGLLDKNADNTFDMVWLDRDEDGVAEKTEMRRLKSELPWATFPSSVSTVTVTHADKISHFMDYTYDTLFDESAVDLDKDGDIERHTIVNNPASSGIKSGISFQDRDNDTDFDAIVAFYIDETGILVISNTMPIPPQMQVPVMTW